ncbi:hypothetical protein ACFW6E_45140 [Streptomyces olivaceoviridis]|uniref:hypothetical protein n=1 Tax=Streptomyces olivaceoviridis TaxID=1921 RepID=UPI003678AC33
MAEGKSLAAAHGAWIVFEDEAGVSMTPPRARTWGRRGYTPVIRVRGRSRRRTSVAALCCYKPGVESRLIHRPRNHLLLKGARKSFSVSCWAAREGRVWLKSFCLQWLARSGRLTLRGALAAD